MANVEEDAKLIKWGLFAKADFLELRQGQSIDCGILRVCAICYDDQSVSLHLSMRGDENDKRVVLPQFG